MGEQARFESKRCVRRPEGQKTKDGYTSIEEYLNGTDPTVFIDYTKPENNINTLN